MRGTPTVTADSLDAYAAWWAVSCSQCGPVGVVRYSVKEQTLSNHVRLHREEHAADPPFPPELSSDNGSDAV
jgi:hypothetical protein